MADQELTASGERPLVTFALLAYNQEQYIREAVAGAFAQTYSPLKIVLSDDCSSDRTFEIMAAMAERYQGPHQIKLNRNESNLGIGAHINRIMQLATGELIVAAAGDDISMPQRVQVLYDAWVQSERRAGSMFSDVLEITEDGTPKREIRPATDAAWDLELLLDGAPSPVIGSSHCWHRQIFEVFGPLLPGVVNEDSAIFFRSSLLGFAKHIPSILVRHRRHPGNLGSGNRRAVASGDHLLAFWDGVYCRDAALHANLLHDLDTLESLQVHVPRLEAIRRKARRNLKFALAARRLVAMPSTLRVLGVLRFLRCAPNWRSLWIVASQLVLPDVYLACRRLIGRG